MTVKCLSKRKKRFAQIDQDVFVINNSCYYKTKKDLIKRSFLVCSNLHFKLFIEYTFQFCF